MKFDCYLSLGCASETTLRENLNRALELEDVKAQVNFRRITDIEAAELGLKGSPSEDRPAYPLLNLSAYTVNHLELPFRPGIRRG